MTGVKRLIALRGAAMCENSAQDIKKQTVEMYDELLRANKLGEEDIVSVFFSVTGDIDAKNPATALREEGRAENSSLFVNQEAAFAGSPSGVIRVLIHCYLDAGGKPFHVYINGAEILRPDRAANQDG